ncbi:MAG: hypothetical protein QM648_11210 [Solirubrobacterales bacterium]
MSKNTRWALAIVGAAIIIVAAVVIGTGKDNTDATPTHEHEGTTSGQTQSTGSGTTTPSGSTSSGGSDDSAGSGGGEDSGGASPGDPGSGSDESSGGASPQQESGGAGVSSVLVSPVLTASSPRTVKVDKGEVVTIRAKSSQPATLHIHGYDKMVELKAGKTGRITFKATIDGEFPIEFHYSGSEAEAGTLRVNP